MRTALFEELPLLHRFRRSVLGARVHPRLVIADEHAHVTTFLLTIEQRKRCRAVGSARWQVRQLLRVGHHRVTRIQFNRHDTIAKRNHASKRVSPQNCRSKQSCHVNASHRRRRALPMTRDRTRHRRRHVNKDENLRRLLVSAAHHRERRHVLDRDFHRILQRFSQSRRDRSIGVPIRDHQLIRQHARLGNLLAIAQLLRNQPHRLGVIKHRVTRERIQVHPRRLPWALASQRNPVLHIKRQAR